VAASESRGVIHRLTEGLRHFAKMNVVGTRRKPSERYRKCPYRSKILWFIFEIRKDLQEVLGVYFYYSI